MNNIPLRYVIPAIYVIVTLIIGLVSFIYTINNLEETTKNHELDQLQKEFNIFQGRIEYILKMDPDNLDRDIADIYSLEHIENVFLSTPQNLIYESSCSAFKDKSVDAVFPPELLKTYDRTISTEMKNIFYDAKEKTFHIFYPIRYTTYTSDQNLGVLYASKDISNYLLQLKKKKLSFLLELMGIYLFLTLFVSYVIYKRYLKRIQQIIDSVNSCQDGDFECSIDTKGDDDISHLAEGINGFIHSIKVQRDALKENLSFLNEYKKVVDASSIVSIGDIRGRITYVNDAFVDISGYSREELVGQMHSIIRHEDVDKSVFENMWKTIQKKEIWKGTVKNKNKNGEAYWVDAIVMPILNHEGKIVEYISLRYDITDKVKLLEEIEDTQKEIIYTVGAVSETRSKETGHHVKRVAEYSELLALHYGLPIEKAEELKNISPMHDIGKVGIEDSILNKPGKLTDEEFEVMKTHATLGYNMLKDSKQKLLQLASIVAHQHHENWDGSGYPLGLQGEEIHIYGRITAIADVFDALGSDRVYKKAWDDDQLFSFLKEQRGKKFDPNLVDLFFEHLDEIKEIRKKYSDI